MQSFALDKNQPESDTSLFYTTLFFCFDQPPSVG
jgi:hypothetical protein